MFNEGKVAIRAFSQIGILWSYLVQFSAQAKKNKKNLLQQKFFIFQEMKLSSYNIKTFQGRENLKKFLIF